MTLSGTLTPHASLTKISSKDTSGLGGALWFLDRFLDSTGQLCTLREEAINGMLKLTVKASPSSLPIKS